MDIGPRVGQPHRPPQALVDPFLVFLNANHLHTPPHTLLAMPPKYVRSTVYHRLQRAVSSTPRGLYKDDNGGIVNLDFSTLTRCCAILSAIERWTTHVPGASDQGLVINAGGEPAPCASTSD